MTDAERTGPAAKAPPPTTLSLRAAGPRAIRLRRGVVQAAVVGASALLAGALAWAFVVQPQLREAARDRAGASDMPQPTGPARPTDLVRAQPASYDRLPPPRTLSSPSPAAKAAASKARAPRSPARPSHNAPHAALSPHDLAAASDLFFADAPHAPAERAPGAAAAADIGAADNGHALTPPMSPYEIKAGAVIPAILLSAVDTARAGPVVAVVSAPVYDTVTGRDLLLPQGARLIGRCDGQSAYGERRAFITWERLILPNGKSLVLTGEPGVDAEGAVGVRGEVDRRLGPLAVATLFAGAITTLGQAARDHDGRGGGLLGDAGDAAAIEGAQVGGRLIGRELDVRPSIRLRPGARVRVLLTHDLLLEPYAP